MKLPTFWWLPIGRVPEVSPAEFKHWLDEGRPLKVLDARTSLEYQQGTIASAIHAPLTAMPASIAHLPLDSSVPVVVLCLSGHRSLPGVRWLRAHGYEAYSLQGGIMSWKNAGYHLQQPGKNGA